MPFKNPNQRKFLYAMDKNKQQNQSSSNALTSPQMNIKQTPMIHVPQASGLKLNQSQQPINPIGVPALPGLNKLPKFGKIKNSLKGGPFKK